MLQKEVKIAYSRELRHPNVETTLRYCVDVFPEDLLTLVLPKEHEIAVLATKTKHLAVPLAMQGLIEEATEVLAER